MKECLWSFHEFSLVPNSSRGAGSCFLKGKAVMNICFSCFFCQLQEVLVPHGDLRTVSWFSMEIFSRKFFPKPCRGQMSWKDPRRNRDFLFFLEIMSGSPKMTSPKESPLKAP